MGLLLILLSTPVCIFFSYVIANWAEKYRDNGFWWIFFFCLTLTPFVGFMIALLSGDKGRKYAVTLLLFIARLCLMALLPICATQVTIRGLEITDDSGCVCLVVAGGLWGLTWYAYKSILAAR